MTVFAIPPAKLWRALAAGAAVLGAAVPASGCGSADPLPEGGERAPLELGIGTQSFYDFGNPQLQALGVRRARIVTSYDVVAAGERGFRHGDPNQPGELENLDRWIAAARRHGYEPLVAFGFSRTRSQALPSVPAYLRAMRAFLDRYSPGWERRDRRVDLVLTAWNEPNHPAQPTFGRPERAAAYFSALRRLCGSRCRVVAGELAQVDRYEAGSQGVCGDPPGSRACDGRRFRADGERMSQADFVRRYLAAVEGGRPPIWGYHPYGDVNGSGGRSRGVRGTRSYAREALRGHAQELWLTEAGGVLEDGDGALEPEDEGLTGSPSLRAARRPDPARGRAAPPTREEREQVAELQHLLGPVAHADPRIERVYYYLFRAKGFPVGGGCRNFSRFDSGLVRECSRANADRLTPGGRAVSDRSTIARPAYEVFKDAAGTRGIRSGG